ncbi:restriction endonuclease [Roseateles toxinivorans]|uniref:Restriction endonuclease n=1 Tax=Roseateles toxinivorans TaxID=270368 RepID=A0A4R6QJE9_9BURK|nr:restriction endonuclease [Roseateles toxinivorans]TDP63003.1 restriction endonuclease [Roseateles toxinivorans]
MPPLSFDLHVLGWKAFEDLVACIFRDILGQTLQVFSEGQDGGRDAAYYGAWTPKNETKSYSGNFCIQCKHTSKPSRQISMSTIDGELEKIERLAKSGLCDNYFLVTNHTLPAGFSEQAEARIVASGAKTARVFGSEWIAQTISENPRLRRLVPRLYGLGDLTQIITHQAYSQARSVLDSIAPDLACFVPTGAYRQSAQALQEHGFVLLLGEPASGKTMIANLLALSAADEWNLQTLMISNPADFSKLWNPNDPGQFLWVDDAFGATQYNSGCVGEWNQQLPKLKAAIKHGARVVFTSRDYIFSAAQRDLKTSAFELFNDSRVIIQVEALTEGERQMILYSHLKAGSQPIKFKTDVKASLEVAAQVPKFLPEIARRFGNPKFTQGMATTSEGVQTFFERPVDVLFDVVSSLAAAEKAAIGLVFIAGGKLSIPVTADDHVAGTLELLGVTLGEVKAALVSLEDSLLKRTRESSSEFWVFRHPTIRDAYATLVGGNPELIDVYIAGVSTERLVEEVTCGNPVQGAKIVVPTNRYQQVLEKLKSQPPAKSWWADPVKSFLGSRCSAEFISAYYATDDISTCIPMHSWNISPHDSGVKILSKLNEAGLLPEEVRKKTVEKIIKVSEEKYSARFFGSSGANGILTNEERNNGLKSVAKSVLMNGASILQEIKESWDREESPDGIFYEIDGLLELVDENDMFDEDSQAEALGLRENIREIVLDLEKNIKEPEYEKLDTEEAIEKSATIARSVFDDVDQ